MSATQSTSDDRLISRIAQGDRLAMQVLYGRHHVRIFRFGLRLVRDEQMAEDLISDIFLDVWRQAGHFEGRSAVSTWLLAITRLRVLAGLRQRQAAQPDAGRDGETAGATGDVFDDPAAAPQTSDPGVAWHHGLTALSPTHREIVDLVYYHEKSVEEVGGIVGIAETTVKTRMFYARRNLAALLRAAGTERDWP